MCLFILPAVEEEIVPEVEEPEESKPEGEAPEFLLTIKTQTVSTACGGSVWRKTCVETWRKLRQDWRGGGGLGKEMKQENERRD